MRITIVGGCGRLGLSMAVVSAQAGHDVWCSDIDKNAVESVNLGKSPISENGVGDLVDLGRQGKLEGLIYATDNILLACREADLIFVVVPTPSLEDGRFSLAHIIGACQPIGEAIRFEDDHKTVVIVSTVNPGDCEKHIIPALEDISFKKAGEDFGFVYSPEFIRQGSIMSDFANPDLVLIGQWDDRSGDAVWGYYSTVLSNMPKIFRTNLINAEIAKLGLNTALVAKLAMANQITWLCHKTKGADAQKVLDVIGADSRIGKKFFKPGLPPGGPCLPRDSKAFYESCRTINSTPRFAAAIKNVRYQEYDILAGTIHAVAQGQSIGILGTTYKVGVDIEEESAGLMLLVRLQDVYRYENNLIACYDPRVYCEEAFLKAVNQSKVLVVTTPHPEFLELLSMDLRGKTVFDCWGLLDGECLNCDKYIRLGRGE